MRATKGGPCTYRHPSSSSCSMDALSALSSLSLEKNVARATVGPAARLEVVNLAVRTDRPGVLQSALRVVPSDAASSELGAMVTPGDDGTAVVSFGVAPSTSAASALPFVPLFDDSAAAGSPSVPNSRIIKCTLVIPCPQHLLTGADALNGLSYLTFSGADGVAVRLAVNGAAPSAPGSDVESGHDKKARKRDKSGKRSRDMFGKLRKPKSSKSKSKKRSAAPVDDVEAPSPSVVPELQGESCVLCALLRFLRVHRLCA